MNHEHAETSEGAEAPVLPRALDKDMAKVIELLTSIDNHLRSMSGIQSLPEVPGSGRGLREASADLRVPSARTWGRS